MRALAVAIVAGIAFLCLALVFEPAQAQVSRPAATATPQRDANNKVVGIPQPSAVPTCSFLASNLFADRSGCIYACTNGSIRTLAGAGCAFPTAAATATANGATATPTPNL